MLLSCTISQSIVPNEDWLKTVSSLLAIYSKEQEEAKEDEDGMNMDYDNHFKNRISKEVEIPLVIHSICLACTSPSHVQSLVEEGILGYWEGALRSEGRPFLHPLVLEAQSHLRSIDNNSLT
jgi:hypothetical protein